MPAEDGRIVVIGASAGGVEALSMLLASLPADLAAPIFVVQHLSPDYASSLPEILSRRGPLDVVFASDGAQIVPGRIYMAPPDHHLLVRANKMHVKKGPRENRFRPSVDALFRSAAFAYGPRAIGIVLSGALDDGTSGLWSIKCVGGTTIVQHPDEAAYESMPASALAQVEIDHCVSVHQMSALLQELVREPVMENASTDQDKSRMGLEVDVATGRDALKKGIMRVGQLSPFTCPECHGVLMRIKEGRMMRFRCHTGHAYSSSSLLGAVLERVEEHYGQAMAILEEAAMLMRQMGDELVENGQDKSAALFFEQAQLAVEQSDQLRSTMQAGVSFSAHGAFGKSG